MKNKKLRYIFKLILSILLVYGFFVATYVIFWILYILIRGGGHFSIISTQPQSIISLAIMLIAALVCGYFVIKEINREGIFLIIEIVVTMMAIDIVSSYFIIKGNPKTFWFPYVFYPSFIFMLLAGSYFRSSRKN